MQGLSVGLLDLGVYRFLAGIGTGAELIVGIPLLAETLGGTHRAKISGVMMTGGAIGTFLGAWVYGLVGNYDVSHLLSTGKIVEGGTGGWRTVFFVGVLPDDLRKTRRCYSATRRRPKETQWSGRTAGAGKPFGE